MLVADFTGASPRQLEALRRIHHGEPHGVALMIVGGVVAVLDGKPTDAGRELAAALVEIDSRSWLCMSCGEDNPGIEARRFCRRCFAVDSARHADDQRS